MQIAPFAVLSHGQWATYGDALIVPRAILETLLRTSFPDLPTDRSRLVSCHGADPDAASAIDDLPWQDELPHAMEAGFNDDRQSLRSDMDVEWFDDVAQAIADGVVGDCTLSLAVERLR